MQRVMMIENIVHAYSHIYIFTYIYIYIYIYISIYIHIYIYMIAPPPETVIFKNFLEKHKENNEFEMLALGRTGRPASCRLDHDGHLGRAGPAASNI